MDNHEFLKSELPPQIEDFAQEHFGPCDRLKLCIRSDMRPDGSFGNAWMIMNDEALGAVCADESGGNPRLLSFHNLNGIDSLEVISGISTAVVEIIRHGIRRRLMRVSNIRQKDFCEAVRLINTYIEDNEWKPGLIDHKRNICPTCRHPLPDNMNICPRCVNKRLMLKKLLVFVKPYTPLVILLFVFTILSTLFGLVTPYMGKVLVDDVLIPVKDFHLLPMLCAAMVAAYALQAFNDGFTRKTSARLGTQTVYDVRGLLFRKLQEQSLAFFSKHKTGGLITRVNQDTAQLEHLLVDFIPYGVSSIIMMAGTLALLFYLSWVLTLFVLIPVAGISAFVYFVFPRFRVFWERVFERRGKLASFAENVINGIRVVKAFAQEDAEVGRFDARSTAFRDAAYTAQKKFADIIPVLHFIVMIASPIVWLVGGILVFKSGNSSDGMTVGKIIAYSGYVGMLFRPVFILTRLAQLIPNTLAAADRVFDVIDSEPEIADVPDALPMPDIKGKIEFRDVEFGYDSNKPVLHDISFAIHPKEMIGLVGHSGAGKSTTINLICRFFDVDSGQILIDGTDIRKIRYEDLRSQIGIVMQETFLLNGTIAENIAYGRPDAGPLDIIKAAKAANAHEFITGKPDGYDTEITQGGGNLSAGEKQRISIARAVLRDPKILILDEATASVDLKTEKEIQDAIAAMVKERTTIAIAHRLSTLRSADRLIVLDKGKLAETGTHEELEGRKDGVYSKLVKLHQDTSSVRVVDG